MMSREQLVEAISLKAIEYFKQIDELEDSVPSTMLIDFVIDKFVQCRNYPLSFTQEKINADLERYTNTIAMGVVDLFMKIGAEGETSHQEKNISRVYENAYISKSIFNDVLPFVRTFF